MECLDCFVLFRLFCAIIYFVLTEQKTDSHFFENSFVSLLRGAHDLGHDLGNSASLQRLRGCQEKTVIRSYQRSERRGWNR